MNRLLWDVSGPLAGWTLLGDTLSEERQAVVDVLKRMDHPIGLGDLAKYLAREYPAVKVLANRMANDGQIGRAGRGLYSLAPARATEPSNHGYHGYQRDLVGDQP